MKALVLAAFAMVSMASAAQANNFNNCQAYYPAGSVRASERGFAKKFKALKKRCAKYDAVTEGAEIKWNQGTSSYECVIGSFCEGN